MINNIIDMAKKANAKLKAEFLETDIKWYGIKA